MKKICILYSGLIRNYEKYIISHLKTFETLKKNNSIEIGSRETATNVYPFAKNDLFCISSFDNYKIYASLYDNLKQYKNLENVPFHPESLLGYHLQNNNIIVNTFIKDDPVLLYHHKERFDIDQENKWGVDHSYAY